MVEHQLPKLRARVRFSSPAPERNPRSAAWGLFVVRSYSGAAFSSLRPENPPTRCLRYQPDHKIGRLGPTAEWADVSSARGERHHDVCARCVYSSGGRPRHHPVGPVRTAPGTPRNHGATVPPVGLSGSQQRADRPGAKAGTKGSPWCCLLPLHRKLDPTWWKRCPSRSEWRTRPATRMRSHTQLAFTPPWPSARSDQSSMTGRHGDRNGSSRSCTSPLAMTRTRKAPGPGGWSMSAERS